MPLIYNGVTVTDIIYKENGLSTTLDKLIYNGITVFEKFVGTLILKEVIFNASGTFVVPSDAVNNEFWIGCTGGGGGNVIYDDGGGTQGAGGGSGRVSGLLTLTPGTSIPVIVGAGGSSPIAGVAPNGGTSSFSSISCSGGVGGTDFGINGNGANGGGAGNYYNVTQGTSNCPAILTLKPGAIDNTTGLYTVKSYAGGYRYGYRCGGAGCYGNYGINTGSGGGDHNIISGTSFSGKVVIYYYVPQIREPATGEYFVDTGNLYGWGVDSNGFTTIWWNSSSATGIVKFAGTTVTSYVFGGYTYYRGTTKYQINMMGVIRQFYGLYRILN